VSLPRTKYSVGSDTARMGPHVAGCTEFLDPKNCYSAATEPEKCADPSKKLFEFLKGTMIGH
ncbi:uncharacterized protein METZ01_LOCUS386464, partial [marine metagenome]